MTPRVQEKLKRAGALALMPLSLVPFALIGPGMIDSHAQFEREQKGQPLAAPTVQLSPAELSRWKPLPAFSGSIPVVAYEGVGEDGPRSVTRLQLARHLAMLSQQGFETISIDQYRDWRHGKAEGIPPRPILIAFDGARLSAYRGADRLLQRYGFRATMFVPTALISSENHALLMWKELKRMHDSGRWDVQAEGTRGDVRVALDAGGATAPEYAVRRYTDSEGTETYAEWQQRVTDDLFEARETLVEHGFEPAALSVPAGDYGRLGNNDPRIPGYAGKLIVDQFGVAFVRDPRNYPGYTTPKGDAARFELGAETTADDLYNWLRAGEPKPAPQPKPHHRRTKR
jgi:peptidoglycan/xylan/chitin deacetylase (PgdA/CDA1 family)